MKYIARILCLLAAVTLMACSGQQDDLVGTWTTSLEGDEFVFGFEADGTLTLSSFGISVTGEYTRSGNRVTLTLFGESDDSTYFIEGDTLTLTDSTGQSITLKRAISQ